MSLAANFCVMVDHVREGIEIAILTEWPATLSLSSKTGMIGLAVLNYHPPLTAFPLAFFIGAFILEILFIISPRERFRHGVDFLLCGALLGTIAAFYSGYQASELANQMFTVPDEPISWHHSIGRILLFVSFPTAFLGLMAPRAKFNRPVFMAAYRVFLVACVGLVIATGYLGGLLVFTHGAGVRVKAPMGVQTPMATEKQTIQ